MPSKNCKRDSDLKVAVSSEYDYTLISPSGIFQIRDKDNRVRRGVAC